MQKELNTTEQQGKLTMMNSIHKGHVPQARLVLAFAAVYVIWGSTYLAIRFGVETIPPFMMAGTRFVFAGLFMYVWARLRGAPPPTRIEWRSAAIIGTLLLFVGNGGVTWAEQHVSSGITALLIATVPMWIVLLDWLWHGSVRPRPGVLIGLAVGFIGMLMLIGPDQLLGNNHIDLAGVGVLMVACMSWAVGSLYSRTAVLPASPLLATAMEMISGGAVLYLVAALTGEFQRFDPNNVSLRSWLSVGYLSVFGSIVALTSYVWLLRVVHASRVATYAYVNPVIAILLGWTLAGEEFTVQMLFAAGIIISAVVLIITNQSKPKGENQRAAEEEPPVSSTHVELKKKLVAK